MEKEKNLIDSDSTKKPESREKQEIKIEKNTLVFIVGMPGSGKSTFAIKNFPLESIVSSDLLRRDLSNNAANQLVSERAFILAAKIAEARLKRGEITVIDAQSLDENARARFYAIAEKYDSSVAAIFMDTDFKESIDRAKTRKRKIDEKVLARKKTRVSQAIRSLKKSEHVDAVYSVRGGEDAVVRLPEEYEKAREADAEFLKEADQAEVFIAAAETGFIEGERREGDVPIKAGSVLFVEHGRKLEAEDLNSLHVDGEKIKDLIKSDLTEDAVKEFLDRNFLPHQIVDAEKVAVRIRTDINDGAVCDIMNFIVKERARNNLTTTVSFPSDFPFVSELLGAIKETADFYGVEIPTPTIKIVKNESQKLELNPSEYPSFTMAITEEEARTCAIQVDRDAPDNAPLFIVGDIQGCYKAMRELAGRIRRENLEKESDVPERKIVFVGDMADRGPYDAESVIYITALVRSGRAMLVKGNHDENLLKGLLGEEVRSGETRETIRHLKERLSAKSLEKIKDMLMEASLYSEWKNLVVVHGALPRVPRLGQKIDDKHQKMMTHGAKKYGEYFSGRPEVYKLHETVAHDPDVLVVGGHSHEGTPELNLIAGSINLDDSVEMKSRLWGMYYPELELASAVEPSVVDLYRMLQGSELPPIEKLPLFVDWAKKQSLIETKNGVGEFEGLKLTTYTLVTDMGNLWETYPSLRHFRGLIIDKDGAVVARPFPKTHKAGEEIPLEELNVVPKKVFEKANGSLGIAYFWGGKWRVATKFSFANDEYTRPSEEMLRAMDMSALDKDKTYLFEIILPNDSHIVDYGGKKELILLNSVNKATGEVDDWESVVEAAKKLGVWTAEDFTEKFKGMTIAQIYEYANREGNVKNLEGFMAVYDDPETGKEVMVKVKAKEYSDKKFVRDYLDWESIIKAVNPETMEISEENVEKLLKYNFDNDFAKAALRARLEWLKEQYRKKVEETKEFIFGPHSQAEKIYAELIAKGEPRQKAVDGALRGAVPLLIKILEERKGEAGKKEKGPMLNFMRALISGGDKPEVTLAKYALAKAKELIESETKKRGKNSFWLTP